ncbi:MAG: hypothetical protein U1E87_05400 [Alphaproteobacteria bacterium]
MTAAPRILSDALPAEDLAAALGRMGARAFQPIAFRLSQTGPMPDRLRAAPKSYRAGNLERGEEIHKGRFALDGSTLEAGGNPWIAPLPSGVRFREELESFSWLKHLGAIDRLVPAGVVEVRERARALTESWIESHGTFAQPAWAPAIVGRRMISWLTEGALSDGADHLALEILRPARPAGALLPQRGRRSRAGRSAAPHGARGRVSLSCPPGDAGPGVARAAPSSKSSARRSAPTAATSAARRRSKPSSSPTSSRCVTLSTNPIRPVRAPSKKRSSACSRC